MEEKQATLFVLSIALALSIVLGECSPAPTPSEAMSVTSEKVVESFHCNPFLCAQDISGELTVEKAVASGEKASAATGTQLLINEQHGY